MNKTTLYLTEELIAALEKEHQRTGASVAEIVRRAITVYLKTPKADRPGLK